MKKIIITLVSLLIITTAFAQVTISRQVIGSTGGYAQGATVSISSTVGEAVVQSLFSTSTILTQGFQQTLKGGNETVEYEVINESCPGAKNGSIFINNVLGCPGPYSVVVVDTLTNDTLGVDTLGTAHYTVVITGGTGCSYSTTIFVGLDSDEDCTLKFYTGITPNGDGVNDTWIIENIEQFPDNTVKLFNRWGNQVFFETGYDNVDRVWNGDGDNGPLSDATYFYVVVVDGKTYKGWVELTR